MTHHRVRVTKADLDRFSEGRSTEDLLGESFRFLLEREPNTSILIINGLATQGQIVKAFGVPMTTVKRYCRHYRKRGISGFFNPAVRTGGHRLTPELLIQVQSLLDQGQSVPKISKLLGILCSTLHKAIDDGRLKQIKKKPRPL